jgi:hypothetical protein
VGYPDPTRLFGMKELGNHLSSRDFLMRYAVFRQRRYVGASGYLPIQRAQIL